MDEIKIKQKFIHILESKKISLSCPLCQGNNFSLEGPFIKTLQNKPGVVSVSGPAIPTLAIVCKKCGYIREFALGAIGLLEDLKNG